MKKATNVKTALKNKLAFLKTVLKTNCVLPILESVLLQNNTASVSDLETFLTIPFDYSGAPIAVPFNSLKQIITDWKYTDLTFSYSSKDTTGKKGIEILEYLVITADTGASASLLCDKAADYPTLQHITNGQNIALNEDHLSGFNIALPLLSNDSLRPQFTGVYFDGAAIAGTDMHRLFVRRIETANMPIGFTSFSKGLIIPAKVLKSLSKANTDNVSMSYDANNVSFNLSDGSILTGRLIDSTYANFNEVIPSESSRSWMVDNDVLQTALEAVSYAANKTTNLVHLTYANNTLEVFANDLDFCTEQKYNIPGIDISQTLTAPLDVNFEIGVNAKFITSILKTLPQTVIKMDLTSSTRAIVITYEKNGDLFLLMPVMIMNYDSRIPENMAAVETELNEVKAELQAAKEETIEIMQAIETAKAENIISSNGLDKEGNFLNEDLFYQCVNSFPNYSPAQILAEYQKEFKRRAEYTAPLSTEPSEATHTQTAPEIAADEIQIIDYSDKAIAVIGNTKPIKDTLKALGGRFNMRLTCGAGWIFPKSKQADIMLELCRINSSSTTSVDTQEAKEWFTVFYESYECEFFETYYCRSKEEALEIFKCQSNETPLNVIAGKKEFEPLFTV